MPANKTSVVKCAAVSVLGLSTCQDMDVRTVRYENLATVNCVQAPTRDTVLEQYSDILADHLGSIAEAVHVEVDE